MSIATPSTTPAFLFTIKGHIEPAAGELYLVCSDDSRFRIGQPLPEYSTAIRLWQVIPSTDSKGLITNVCIVDSKPLSGPDQQQQDNCQIVGRVVQLGKRYQFVQFKVTRPGEKTLKLTCINRDSRIKVGQMWSCTAVRVGSTLQITHATPLDEISDRPAPPLDNRIEQKKHKDTALTFDRIVLPDPAPWVDIALAALCRETRVTGWELQTLREREYGWEWEALVPTTRQRARVLFDSQGKRPQIYQYPVVRP